LTGSAHSNPRTVADGVADDDEWAPFERPDKTATAEVDEAKGKAKSKNMSKDVSFALCRETTAQVTTALDAARRAAEEELTVNEVGLAW
jgi:hypothetical protein